MLVASRALVGVAARSLAETEDTVTLVQYRGLVLLGVAGRDERREPRRRARRPPVDRDTALCDRLVARGLVDRATSDQNRREVLVSLTRAGQALIRSVTAAPAGRDRHGYGPPDGETTRRYCRGIRRVRRGGGRSARRRLEVGLDDVTGRRLPVGGAASRAFARESRDVAAARRDRRRAHRARRRAVRHDRHQALDGLDNLPLWVDRARAAVGLTIAAVAAALDRTGRHTRDGRRVPPRVPRPDPPARRCAALARTDGRRHRDAGNRARRWVSKARRSTSARRSATRCNTRFPRLFTPLARRLCSSRARPPASPRSSSAPATGAVFALEVPYQDDLARRMLGPALVASASRLPRVRRDPRHRAVPRRHRHPAVLVQGPRRRAACSDCSPGSVPASSPGCCAARKRSRRASRRGSACRPRARLSPRASSPRATCRARTSRPVPATTRSGGRSIPPAASWLIAAILVLRCVATSTAVAGGGVGGLFIPLVVAGALAGRVVGGAVQRARHVAVHRDRRGRVPRRRLSRAARRGRVRRRSDRPARLRRPRPARGGRRRARDGHAVGHRLPACRQR